MQIGSLGRRNNTPLLDGPGAAYCSNVFANRKNGEMELRLPLTHELIGEMVGVSRQQVTTIFNEWAGQGIIRYSWRQILLIKPERL